MHPFKLSHDTALSHALKGKGATCYPGCIMRLIRFLHMGQPHWGRIFQDEVQPLGGDPYAGVEETDERLRLAELTLLPPVAPSKILAVGLNYLSHLHGRPRPEKPELFLMPPSALLGPGGIICPPPGAQQVEAEGELVVVIGKRAKDVTPEEAPSHILGYTCGNDVTDRHWQATDKQWWRAKGSDTFAVVGPWIETDLEAGCCQIEATIDDKLVQTGNTKDLIFSVPEVVSFASRHITLEPGDIIFTGTPGDTGLIPPGASVEVTITGIGTLSNRRAGEV